MQFQEMQLKMQSRCTGLSEILGRLPSTCLLPLLRTDKSAPLGTAIHEEGDIVVAVDSAHPPPLPALPLWLQQILNLLDSVTDLC